MADLLIREYRVYNALNLDGGCSTSLAMENPVTHAGELVIALQTNRAAEQSAATWPYSLGASPHAAAEPDKISVGSTILL
jgi:hypothetical protein